MTLWHVPLSGIVFIHINGIVLRSDKMSEGPSTTAVLKPSVPT